MHALRAVHLTVASVLAASACFAPVDREREPTPDPPARTWASPAGRVPTGPSAPTRYRPPVAAEVVDGFRPPPGQFAAGNRGLEYETEPGTPVGAIAAGRVVFAGSVGGSRHVTVVHADGLRSSYSHLGAIEVDVGDRVLGGQAVGRAGRRLHLGVRAGRAYLDPSLLFGAGGVHLVPVR